MNLDSLTIPDIDYRTTAIDEIKCQTFTNEKGKREIDCIIVDGKEVTPTQRFWDSLCSKYGFGTTIFNYFSYDEVFDRIASVRADDEITVAIQDTPAREDEKFEPKLLAVSSVDKPMMTRDMIVDLADEIGARSIKYRDGFITTEHEPASSIQMLVGGHDSHEPMLTLDTPIDGYGKPNIYLSLIREVCSNGLIGMARAFRSGIILGTNESAVNVVERTINSFNNEDGFMAMRDRLDSAMGSWASIFELTKLSRLIQGLKPESFKPDFKSTVVGAQKDPSVLRGNLLEDLYCKSGDVREIYGVANQDSISEKRMKQLPTQCTVYDLLCFASEIATHQLQPGAAMKFQSYFGTMVSNDIYDLEGSCDDYEEFTDFFNDYSRMAKNRG